MYSFSAFDNIDDIQIEDEKAEPFGLGLWPLVRRRKIPIVVAAAAAVVVAVVVPRI
jgi:hypothetical protein